MEWHRVPLSTPKRFRKRLVGTGTIGLVLVAISLGIGIGGYMLFEELAPIDAFLNAAMILSGMGPLGPLQTWGGKLFAGLYALYSGLVLVAATGIILAPAVHRLLHRFHGESEPREGDG
jgi:hypothetical protein